MAFVITKRRPEEWEEALTTTMYTKCTKELCIVLGSQNFLGRAPDRVSKLVYECNSAHMLLEQVAVEEELEEMLLQGANEVAEQGITLGRSLHADVEELRGRRCEQAEWAQALVTSIREQSLQRMTAM